MVAVPLVGVVLSASLGLLGACAGRGAPESPPIQAVDRTLPASAFGSGISSLQNGCFEVSVGPGVGAVRRCKPTREALAARPRSPLTPVHLLAELPLDRPRGLSQRVLFAVYDSKGSGRCFTTVSVIALEELQCEGDPLCARMCLRPSTEERSARLGARATGTYMLVAGTVPAGVKSVHLVFPGGETLTFASQGPTPKSLPGRRVFMADAGRRDRPPRIELVS